MIDKQLFIERFPLGSLSESATDTVIRIIDYFYEDDGFEVLAELAYILATAYHESAHTFNPGIREIGHGGGKVYGRTDPNTGQRYYGRGLCQLTWKANYQKFSEILGVDLVAGPDLALEKENSVKILMIGMRAGHFTGKKLRMFINAEQTDFLGARKVVNGTDKALLISKHAITLYDYLMQAKIPEQNEHKIL